MFWFRHTNTRKHVSEQSWLSGWIILIILAHLAHLAQSYFSSLKYISGIEVFPVATTAFGGENFPLFLEIVLTKDYFILSGKKSKSVFDFLTYSRKTGFSFSYEKVGNLLRANEPSNEIDRVSKFDNFLSFGAKQNALWQMFFALWFFKDFICENSNEIFFNFLWFCVGLIKECTYVYLSMQIQKNMFTSTAAHLWGRFLAFSSLSSVFSFWFQIW